MINDQQDTTMPDVMNVPLERSPQQESIPTFIIPKRTTRSIRVDRPAVVESVLQRLADDLSDRSEWLNNHLRRYAKYRGWTEQKRWQFEGSSDAHLPISMYSCQRMEDTLYNSAMGMQPLMQGKAIQRPDIPKERRVTQLLHDQFFRFAHCPKRLRELIHNIVVDGTAHVFLPWIRGTQIIREFNRIPAPPLGQDLFEYVMNYLHRTYGQESIHLTSQGHRFFLHTETGMVEIEVYEGSDGDVEIVESRDCQFDHLGLAVEDLEDIVIPSNAANPEPPSEANPRGAHHVFRLCAPISMDTVKVRRKKGQYDLLTDTDLEVIARWQDEAPTTDPTQPKEQKDEMEGIESQSHLGEHQTVHVVEVYDRYDVNHDGFEEDVIFTLITNESYEEGVLVRARYLTEIMPPGETGIQRPFEKFVLFEEPNRYYGIGLPELIEGIQDIMNTLFNFGVDAGVLSNTPFFFYRAAGGLKPEVIRMNPGEGYPLDDPRADVYFPQLPGMQGTWVFNELAMLNQFLEKLTMQSALNFGGVPQGKSSALRTSGNMQSVLGQGDLRIERVLRQLMEGLSHVWTKGLALCQRYLPPMTEYRLLGVPGEQETFDRIQDRSDIAGRFRFTWNSTVLNTNPALKAQRAMSIVQTVAHPLLLQAQITGPEEVYRAARNYLDALDEPNPDQYVKRPLGVSAAPKITAEQAISMILRGDIPYDVNPQEPIQEHAQKLTAFMQSVEFGLLNAHQTSVFAQYLKMVADAMQRIQQQAQMVQAAKTMQAVSGAGQNGQGGPTPGPPNPQAASLSPASPVEAGMGPQGNAPQGMPMGGIG